MRCSRLSVEIPPHALARILEDVCIRSGGVLVWLEERLPRGSIVPLDPGELELPELAESIPGHHTQQLGQISNPFVSTCRFRRLYDNAVTLAMLFVHLSTHEHREAVTYIRRRLSITY